MNTDDDALASAYKKIEREKALLNAANAMRQQTNNESVRSRLDNQMREGRRNIQYFEEKLRELQMRKMGQGVDNMNLGPSDNGGPAGRLPNSGMRSDRDGPPAPPPKDSRGNYIQQGGSDRGDYGTQEYSQIGGHGDMMPPRHPYAPPGPNAGIPKSRPNFTKLGKLQHAFSIKGI